LVINTPTSVYTTNIKEGEKDIKKLFDRYGKLAEPGANIIGFDMEPANKWCALSCLSTPDGG
jgi:hypothetical protein